MRTNPLVMEWINLAARWAHVFAAILWVGSTYFFTWLDGRFEEAARANGGKAGEVWMVHSGGGDVADRHGAARRRLLHGRRARGSRRVGRGRGHGRRREPRRPRRLGNGLRPAGEVARRQK